MKREPIEWPVVALGATFTGLGAACAAPGRVLVVERTMLVGGERIAAFRPGESWHRETATDEGRKLQQEFIERRLIGEEGAAHLPAMSPVLFRWIQERRLRVRFLTEIVGIEPSGDGYMLTLHDASGLSRIRTRHLLDTTDERISRLLLGNAGEDLENQHSGKAISAMLHGEGELPADKVIPIEGTDGNAIVTAGLLPGEAMLRMPLRKEADWPEARQSLHDFWRGRRSEWSGWMIAAIADVMTAEAPRGPHAVAAGWTWLPSGAYANGLQAFDAGNEWMRKEELGHDLVKTS